MIPKFVVFGGLWFDKQNGNTNFVSKILDLQIGYTYYTEYQYGYGHAYFHGAEEFIRNDLGYKEFTLLDMGSAYFKKSDLKHRNF